MTVHSLDTSMAQAYLWGDIMLYELQVTFLKLSISISVNRIIKEQKLSEGINHFALKVDKLKIVKVKWWRRTLQCNKAVSTLPLKEASMESFLLAKSWWGTLSKDKPIIISCVLASKVLQCTWCTRRCCCSAKIYFELWIDLWQEQHSQELLSCTCSWGLGV